jgi:hypothetical protein
MRPVLSLVNSHRLKGEEWVASGVKLMTESFDGPLVWPMASGFVLSFRVFRHPGMPLSSRLRRQVAVSAPPGMQHKAFDSSIRPNNLPIIL